MMKFKKGLTIEIDDQRKSDEEILNEKVIVEWNKIKQLNSEYNDQDYQLLYQINNPILNQLLIYTQEENTKYDLSYNWLKKFGSLNYLNKAVFLDSIHCLNLNSNRDFSSEFKLLKLITESPEHKDRFVRLPKNILRLDNRYPDLLPYHHNIAMIESPSSNISLDIEKSYINASFIDGPLEEDSKLFIATQAPLKNTAESFWRLIINKNVNLVVMLCNLVEDGRAKCEIYWPLAPNTKIVYQDFEISLLSENWILENCIIKREIKIKNTKNETDFRVVTQVQAINWPDYLEPEKDMGYNTLEQLLIQIQESICYNPKSPILIHCSGGVGRTGTMIAIYNIIKSFSIIKIWNNLSEFAIRAFMSVFNTVRKLREQRYGMVSSLEQYRYIYEFCIEWYRKNFIFNNNCM